MADRLHTSAAMRAVAVTVLSLASAVTAIGCVERDPFNASDIAAADAFHAREAAKAQSGNPVAPSTTGAVRCRCDGDGNLHVNAPQGSTVRATEGQEDAEAEITLPERRPGTPIRTTVSLGFVGDGKLTQSPSHGGPWNAPDGLLPKHAHGMPDRPYGYGGYAGRGYYVPARFYGYGGYGYGGSYATRGGGGGGASAPPQHTGAIYHPPANVHSSGAAPGGGSYGGGHARGGYGPR
jgi:hypothetical protein